MRYLLSLFLLLPITAAAQPVTLPERHIETTTSLSGGGTVSPYRPTVVDPYQHTALERPNQQCFAKLPALAKRLHVGPAGFGALVAHGCDGQVYDVISLIGALLDRMDRAVPINHTPLPKPRPIEAPR